MTQTFDFEKALSELQAGKDLTDKDGVLMPLIKQLTEAAITAAIEHHITNGEEPNRNIRSQRVHVPLSLSDT